MVRYSGIFCQAKEKTNIMCSTQVMWEQQENWQEKATKSETHSNEYII